MEIERVKEKILEGRPGFPRQYGPQRADHQPGIPLFPQEATRDLVTIFLLTAIMFFLSAFDAVPRTRSESAVVGTDRPGLVPPVLVGPPESRGHLPPVHAGRRHPAEGGLQRGVLGRPVERHPDHRAPRPPVPGPWPGNPARECT